MVDSLELVCSGKLETLVADSLTGKGAAEPSAAGEGKPSAWSPGNIIGVLRRTAISTRLSLIALLSMIAVVSVSAIARQALRIEAEAGREMLRFAHAQSLQQGADMMHDSLN